MNFDKKIRGNIKQLYKLFSVIAQPVSIRKFLESAVLIFILASCGPPLGLPECVDEDDWGNVVSKYITVNASDPYTYSGIRVPAGAFVDARISGAVDLCAGREIFRADPNNPNPNNPPIARGFYELTGESGTGVLSHLYYINPWLNQWQPAEYTRPDGSGRDYIRVEQNQKFSIAVNGSYQDRMDIQKEGSGLYVYIDGTAPGDAPNPPTVNGGGALSADDSDPHNWWYGEPIPGGVDILPERNRKAGTTADFPEFFEIFDNSSVGAQAGGFQGIAPRSGNLLFRYARTADARGLDRSGGTRFSPWLGKYAWDNPGKCNTCRLTVIPAVCAAAAIFGGYRICVAAAVAACSAAGRLQELPGAETKKGRKCREHALNADHWIHGAYDGSDGNDYIGRQANEGGYEISIGTGCLGTEGQYMEMHIGGSDATLQEQTSPAGCIVGTDPGCEVVIDGWTNSPIFELVYETVPDGPVYSLDMRNLENLNPPVPPRAASPDGIAFQNFAGGNPHYLGYQVPGHFYWDGAPRGGGTGTHTNGELWFHINDNVTSPSNPRAGYYTDNVGSYKVKLETVKETSTFSDFTQKIINPIRGLIFGYCRTALVFEDADGNPYSYDEERVDVGGNTITYNASDFSQLDYDISEDDCALLNYTDYYGNSVPAWNPGLTERMYKILVGDTANYDGTLVSNFVRLVRAVLVLYVLVYAFSYMMGMVSDDYGDFIKRLIKLSIIGALISPNSWEFFNEYLFRLFIDGVDNLIILMTSDFTGSSTTLISDTDFVDGSTIAAADIGNTNLFKFADLTIDMLFSQSTRIKIAGLLFSSPIGFIYIILIVVGIVLFILAVFKAIMLYLLALLAIALLVIVAPIFLLFILFDRTRGLFDQWIRNLINYTIQPVLVITALAMFNIFVYNAIYTLLHYRVCWDTVWNLRLFSNIPVVPTLEVPLVRFYLPSPEGSISAAREFNIPIQFFLMLIYIIICSAMLKFVDWMASLASELTLGNPNATLSNAGNLAANATGKMANVLNKGTGVLTGAALGAARGGASGGNAYMKGASALGGAVSGGIKGAAGGSSGRLASARTNGLKRGQIAGVSGTEKFGKGKGGSGGDSGDK